MSPRKIAQAAFASAVILLFLSGLATYLTIERLLQSEKWVIHSHEVQSALGDVDSAVINAGRARSGYVISGNAEFLSSFEAAGPKIHEALQHLRELTTDNPRQQELGMRLQEITAQRQALFQESVDLKKTDPQDQQGQDDISRRSVPFVSEMTSTMQQMRDEEQKLLGVRAKSSERLFILAVVVL